MPRNVMTSHLSQWPLVSTTVETAAAETLFSESLHIQVPSYSITAVSPQWREMDRDSLPQVLAPFLPDFTSGQRSSPEALLALWDLRPVVESYGRTVAILLKDWPELDTWALEQAQKNARFFLFMLCTLEWAPSLSATTDWTLCNKTFNLLTHYHGLCEDLTPPSTV